MTGARLAVGFEAGPVRDALRRVDQALREPHVFLGPVATALARNTVERFWNERDPQGFAWKPLSEFYAPMKEGPGILRGPGGSGLWGSINSEVRGETVVVGASKPYAAIHQFGGVIKPKRGPHLIFRDRNGKAFGAARQVTIPARPYLGIGPEDERDILEAVEDATARLIGGKT